MPKGVSSTASRWRLYVVATIARRDHYLAHIVPTPTLPNAGFALDGAGRRRIETAVQLQRL
jgi:hypothetical protein